jgi:uncharacterized membrane protein
MHTLKNLSKTEYSVISAYVILFPVSLFLADFVFFNPFFMTTLTTSFLLFLITVLHYVFKRPYLPGVFFCHQNTCRTLRIKGHYLPICSRCTGIYLGVYLSLPLSLLYQGPLLIFLMIPLIIDGYLVYQKKKASSHTRRLSTGLLFGIGLIYSYALYHQFLAYLASLVF